MNQHLDLLVRVLTFGTLVECVMSAVVARWAFHNGWPGSRTCYAAIGALSVFQAGLYAVLLFTSVLPSTWSEVARGHGWVAIPVIWIWPMVNNVHEYRRFVDAVAREKTRQQ